MERRRARWSTGQKKTAGPTVEAGGRRGTPRRGSGGRSTAWRRQRRRPSGRRPPTREAKGFRCCTDQPATPRHVPQPDAPDSIPPAGTLQLGKTIQAPPIFGLRSSHIPPPTPCPEVGIHRRRGGRNSRARPGHRSPAPAPCTLERFRERQPRNVRPSVHFETLRSVSEGNRNNSPQPFTDRRPTVEPGSYRSPHGPGIIPAPHRRRLYDTGCHSPPRQNERQAPPIPAEPQPHAQLERIRSTQGPNVQAITLNVQGNSPPSIPHRRHRTAQPRGDLEANVQTAAAKTYIPNTAQRHAPPCATPRHFAQNHANGPGLYLLYRRYQRYRRITTTSPQVRRQTARPPTTARAAGAPHGHTTAPPPPTAPARRQTAATAQRRPPHATPAATPNPAPP